MSRVGVRPIKIEEGILIKALSSKVSVNFGDKCLEVPLAHGLKIKVSDNTVQVEREGDSRELRSKHGLTARLLRNAILGVKSEFSKALEFNGTGYRATVADNTLVLNMGYSHEVRLEIPEDLKVSVVKNAITITGIAKDKVGQFAAKVREIRPPEVYKGKGIKYRDEFIKRKAGKTAASK